MADQLGDGLARFGVEPEPEDDLDRRDDADIKEQCVAQTASGDRCSNAVSRMTNDPFCSSHSRADDVQVVADSDE